MYVERKEKKFNKSHIVNNNKTFAKAKEKM